MIELSIVLLILSLLVGSLLVGRQIVDRAKIQKIVSELRYYDDAFQQFYDTYREVPGSFTYETCMKYAEFEGYECDDSTCTGDARDKKTWRDHATFCNLFGIRGSIPKKIISNHGYMDDQFWAVWEASRIIGDAQPRRRPAGGGNQYFNLSHGSGSWSTTTRKSSYSGDVVIQARGIHKKYLNYYSRDNALLGYDYLLKRLADKNMLLFHDNWSTGSRRVAIGTALNAKMMSELDAKIDDGRPTTGRLIGLKGASAYSITDVNLSAEYCYDKAGNDIEKAIYNNSNDLKYGCDFVYVLTDVK